ncbi:MAG: hypothetical protein DI551_08480 [Micavibrio aeruginosavorus]|uniref:Uncharacterized protein n=1 Tax=Micavibrio aeruginosavorus TaxID=349221 RepID=A0A2W5MUZ8_9BACT|nr:MAG: hypothetical protein DI551_08480 [Micavibrio aeruginosavorus]
MRDDYNSLSEQTEGQWLKQGLGVKHTGLVAVLTNGYLIDGDGDEILLDEDVSFFTFKIADEIDRNDLTERIVAWIKEEDILNWAKEEFEDFFKQADVLLKFIFVDDFEIFGDEDEGISLIKQRDMDEDTVFEGVVDEEELRKNIDHVLKYNLKIGEDGNDLRNQMVLNF